MFFLSNTLRVLAALAFSIPWPGTDTAMITAERFFKAGHYDAAITEFKRFIFFHGDENDPRLSYGHYKIGLAFANLGCWRDSVDALNAAIQLAPDGRTRDERRLSLAMVQIAHKDYNSAKWILIRLQTYAAEGEARNQATYLRMICAIYEHDWSEALSLLSDASLDERNPTIENEPEIKVLLESARTAKIKSPSLAKWLSTIVPGAGQAYAGKWLDGLNALAINFGVGYWIYSDIQSRQYRSAIFDALVLFRRFYEGNRTNAKTAVLDHNERIHREWADKILNTIMER